MSQRKKDRVTDPANQAGAEADQAGFDAPVAEDRPGVGGERFSGRSTGCICDHYVDCALWVLLTISPDLTLEDSGELAVASMYGCRIQRI